MDCSKHQHRLPYKSGWAVRCDFSCTDFSLVHICRVPMMRSAFINLSTSKLWHVASSQIRHPSSYHIFVRMYECQDVDGVLHRSCISGYPRFVLAISRQVHDIARSKLWSCIDVIHVRARSDVLKESRQDPYEVSLLDLIICSYLLIFASKRQMYKTGIYQAWHQTQLNDVFWQHLWVLELLLDPQLPIPPHQRIMPHGAHGALWHAVDTSWTMGRSWKGLGLSATWQHRKLLRRWRCCKRIGPKKWETPGMICVFLSSMLDSCEETKADWTIQNKSV